MAHELIHTLQQRGLTSFADTTIRRRWAAPPPECASEPQDKWIQTLLVDQTEKQTVTLHWSDGSEEEYLCSAGKGHCCCEGSDSLPACEGAGSRIYGTNCTPNSTGAGFPVEHRDSDHGGIKYWTEFEPNRFIALHSYYRDRVDGTPRSHGCVRLHEEVAKRIFCGVHQRQTKVQVTSPARPDCANAALQFEWAKDFDTAALPLDGERVDRNQILETRRELTSALGRRIAPADFASLTAADIPRCTVRRGGTAVLSGPQVQPKLKIGAIDDPAEREADRIADQVMRMPDPQAHPNAASGRQDTDQRRADAGAPANGSVQLHTAGPMLARQAVATQPPQFNFPSCSKEWQDKIRDATEKARTWVNKALSRLAAVLHNPAAQGEAEQNTHTSLHYHFKLTYETVNAKPETNFDKVTQIYEAFQKINAAFSTPLPIICEPKIIYHDSMRTRKNQSAGRLANHADNRPRC